MERLLEPIFSSAKEFDIINISKIDFPKIDFPKFF